MKYKILYLIDKNYVLKKMSRTRFHSIESLSLISDLTISGNNWDNFDSNKSILDNFGEQIYKFNAVICYKPLEYKKFNEIPITKIIRYNEMYDVKNTINEINNSLPNIIICHHYNDYIYYKKHYLENYSNNYNIQFFYIPHCCNKKIFKDYNLNKIYDITISGAFGNSILGNHYPIRQRISSLVLDKLKDKYNIYYHKHPGYTLDDAYTNKYCIELAKIYNQSKICITCSGKPKSRFGKYVEIPSCNSIVCGDIPQTENDETKELNNIMIVIDENDDDNSIIQKIVNILENESLYLDLKNKSFQWSKKYSQKKYAQFFINILDKYYNNQNKIVQCLWIGDKLGPIELLSLKSFILNNHIVHLYIYDTLINIPIHKNIIIKDANEIISKNEIYTYENNSYSAFSNVFRFELLYKKGGYWCDLDLINLKHLDFKNEFVFVSEPSPDYENNIPTSCLIKMPKFSYIAKQAVYFLKNLKTKVLNGEIKWGLGPLTIKKIIEKYKMINLLLDYNCVCSCHPNDCISIFKKNDINENDINKNNNILFELSKQKENMYCIHLWNKVIQEFNLLKTKNNECLFNDLLIKYNKNIF